MSAAPTGGPPPSVRFLNRVYPPDGGATGVLLAELAEALAADGHEVSVVAARTTPGAPRHEVVRGVRVSRVSPVAVSRATLAGRAVSDLSLYPALAWRAWRLPPADVTVLMSDPPLLGSLALLPTWQRRGRGMQWVQDRYPEVATALGVLAPGGMATRLLAAVARASLRRSSRVVVPGRCMAERLTRQFPDLAEIVRVVPNWADPRHIHPPLPEHNPLRREWGLAGQKVVAYAGNFGRAHPMHLVVEAAELLRERTDITFLLIGDGPGRRQVEKAVHERGIGNVRLLPFQPRERLAETLGVADLHLILLRPELAGLVVPSKLYGVLAAGRPCLFVGPEAAEPARVLRAADCGATIAPDAAALAAALPDWLDDPARCRNAGQRARIWAERHPPADAVAAFRALLHA